LRLKNTSYKTDPAIIVHLKALGLLQAFEESAGWALLSSLCDNSHLHISVFK